MESEISIRKAPAGHRKGRAVRRPALAGVLIAAGLLPSATGAAPAAVEKARPADDAAEMVGVNTHLVYADTDLRHRVRSIVKPRLIELGRPLHPRLGHDRAAIRRAVPGPRAPRDRALLINWDPGPAARDAVKALNDHPSRPVAMVEPSNERDCERINDWRRLGARLPEGDVEELQERPRHRRHPCPRPLLLQPPGQSRRARPGVPDASEYMDRGNLHDYSGRATEGPRGAGWGIDLDQAIGEYRKLAGAKPLVSTETGYKMSGPSGTTPWCPSARRRSTCPACSSRTC